MMKGGDDKMLNSFEKQTLEDAITDIKSLIDQVYPDDFKDLKESMTRNLQIVLDTQD